MDVGCNSLLVAMGVGNTSNCWFSDRHRGHGSTVKKSERKKSWSNVEIQRGRCEEISKFQKHICTFSHKIILQQDTHMHRAGTVKNGR